MSYSDSRSTARARSAIATLLAGIVVIFLLLTFLGGFDIVPAGYRGVKTRFGRVVGESLPSGLQFKIPFVEHIEDIEIREQKLELKTSASSRDLQTVQSTIAVNYHPVDETVHELYEDIGTDYMSRVLEPAVEETVKAVTAQYTAEELITKRTDVRTKMENMLSERVEPNHLAITKFNIVDFEFSHSFNEAIEAKQTAEQEALRAQNDLRRIKVEADQDIEEARGKTEALKLNALARAQAITVEADAEAKAQELLAKVVTRDVILLRAIEKWDGVMPRAASEAVPFFNIDSRESIEPLAPSSDIRPR